MNLIKPIPSQSLHISLLMPNKILTFTLLIIFIAITSTYGVGANFHRLVSIKHGVGAKLYAPSYTKPFEKLPLVVYYHGGGFVIGSTYWPPYDDFLHAIVRYSNVIILSVEYRLSGSYPLPIGYDDSWSALQWVSFNHSNGFSSENVDFERVFLAGDSAGGNIAHNMAMRIASNEIKGLKIKGIALLCPYFWGSLPVGIEPRFLARVPFAGDWLASTRGLIGIDDVRINPLLDPKLSKLGCSKVLVVVGRFDLLYWRGVSYAEKLKHNGYNGNVELMEFWGWHDFFLRLPFAIYRFSIINRLSSFFNN